MLAEPKNPTNHPGDLAGRLALSIVELAAATGISRRSIYSAVERGDLRLRKIGRRSVVSIDDARKWINGEPMAAVARAA